MAQEHPATCYLGLGSNLGDRLGHLRSAVGDLADHTQVEVVRRSGLYETAPVGGPPNQGPFLNAILAVQIKYWDPSSLLVDNRVRYSVRATLFGSVGKVVLWSGEIPQGIAVAGGTGAAPRDPVARAQSAAREFVKELLELLPRRRS